jgi:hypothetical protein
VNEYRALRQATERAAMQETKAQMIAAYRREHTEVGWWVSDEVVAALAAIEAVGKRAPEL